MKSWISGMQCLFFRFSLFAAAVLFVIISTTCCLKSNCTHLNLDVYSINLRLWYALTGRFPGDSGFVAPGLSCKYVLRFAPDSLADYEDFIVVEAHAEHKLVVPIAAWRPPPILTCKSHYNPPNLLVWPFDHALLCWRASSQLFFSTKSSGLRLLSDWWS